MPDKQIWLPDKAGEYREQKDPIEDNRTQRGNRYVTFALENEKNSPIAVRVPNNAESAPWLN